MGRVGGNLLIDWGAAGWEVWRLTGDPVVVVVVDWRGIEDDIFAIERCFFVRKFVD